ncbi:CHT1 [Symbiodinium sp. CCMP2456]|nr:CHT1 [Symbiodinium sp. CCMP2456]
MGVEVWERLVSPRQEITLTLIFWQARINDWDPDSVYVDLAKSYERAAWRYDGYLPPLTTNSRIYSFRMRRYLHGYELLGMQGFNVEKLNFAGFTKSALWSVLAGNCMSMPVIGNAVMAVLLYGNLGRSRSHFRQGKVPTPTSQATTLEQICNDEPSEGSDSAESVDPEQDECQ